MSVRALALIALLAGPSIASARVVSVENPKLSITFDLNERGISLTSIRNSSNNVEHISQPSSLFELSADGTILQSSTGLIVDGSSNADRGAKLAIQAHARHLPLKVELEVSMPGPDAIAILKLTITNTGQTKMSLRSVFPNITGIVTAGPATQRMGMVPAEIGSVVPLENTAPPLPLAPARNPPAGMRFDPQLGMPGAMNSMEVASVYDTSGGGIFFADVDGDLDNDISPIEFNLSAYAVSGYLITELAPGETKSLSRLAIGTHDTGDWHAAIDYYTSQHRPRWRFPATPAWLRDQGAIYGYSGGGAGGIYLMYPGQDLKRRIDSFRELPRLLDEAKRFGTNVVYIWDYWDGGTEQAARPYANKGDYIPRTDLGGIPAFVEGIQAIHQQGGKIVVYVEAFIILNTSQIGQEKGRLWGGRDSAGEFWAQYRNNYSMPSFYKPWQDYLVKVCEKLVRDYGVDGIFLDSWAWRMNLAMKTEEEGILHTPKEYNQGVLTVADRVRSAIQAIKPDAVVIGETTAGPIARHWDGGLSADFAWMAAINQQKILGSPVRYGAPEVNFMSNGRNLNELNQIFAAGHSLALCDAQLPWAAYIKPLVHIRQEYKDALIYGKQAYQPATGDKDVAAYYYEGSKNRLITAVNTSAQRHYTGSLTLPAAEAGSTWQDLLTEEVYKSKDGKLTLKIPPDGLRVLQRK